MEINSQCSSTQELKLGNWTLLEEIGSGNTSKVFMGVNSATNEQVAVKVFFETEAALEAMENEVVILQALCHENIIGYKESLQAVELINSKGQKSIVSALIMEFAGCGSFFELVQNRTFLSERMVRSYFLQLIDALDHIHKNQIAHRDIKLENILLDNEYSIKLADFGYSSKMRSRKPFEIAAGTSVYFAPEIHEGFPHYGEHADLFAAGMILFVAAAGHMPFGKAASSDKLYNMLLTRDYKSFWVFHERLVQQTDENIILSEEFKDLVTKMLDENPRNRPNIEEIRVHPWMQGKVYHKKQISERIRFELL
jgi:serine/threonine protein kinase